MKNKIVFYKRNMFNIRTINDCLHQLTVKPFWLHSIDNILFKQGKSNW